VSPVANAAKNFWAAGAGPSCFGVQAETALVTTRTAAPTVAADAIVNFVAIVADVRTAQPGRTATHRD
jgi:hypothetical protein